MAKALMKIQDARDYAKKVTDIPFTIKVKPLRTSWGACVHVKKRLINVNRLYWHLYKTQPLEWKSMILHEVGHVYTAGKSKSKSEKELMAQLWAIKKARELGNEELRTFLIRRFQEWGTYDWNGKFRKYLMARKKFIDRKMRYN